MCQNSGTDTEDYEIGFKLPHQCHCPCISNKCMTDMDLSSGMVITSISISITYQYNINTILILEQL